MDYYIPSKQAKKRLIIKIVVQSIILFASFMYCKNLAFASLELFETDPKLAQQGLLRAFFINAAVITVVFYLIVWRRMLLAFKSFNEQQWPPKNANLGVKTPLHTGRAARAYAIKFGLFSTLFLIFPVNWQYQAYSNYRQLQVFDALGMDTEIKSSERHVLGCEPNTYEPSPSQ